MGEFQKNSYSSIILEHILRFFGGGGGGELFRYSSKGMF